MPKTELYQLASAFFKTRLWDQLCDSELFAVRMPEGETGYVCVMGMLGDHLALAVYPGSAGLDAYRLIAQGDEQAREIVRLEHMMSQDCVMCSFEDREDLSERERTEIGNLGLRFRGKRSYPMFKRYKPRRFPWYVEDPRDEERLRLGLLAGLEVARRLKRRTVQQDLFHTPDPGSSKEDLGFSEGPPFDREIPLLTPKEDGTFEWGVTPLPAPVQPTYALPRLENDLTLAQLRKLKKTGAWECGLFMHPEPTAQGETDEEGYVAELADAPFFPYSLLMVDHADGMVLYFGLTSRPDGDMDELLDAFVQSLLKYGRPQEVLVPDARTHALLAGIARQLDIRLSLREGLAFLEEAEDGLLQSVDASEDAEEALDALLEASEGKELELPAALCGMLEEVLARGTLPDATAEKARRLLGKRGGPGRAEQALPPARMRKPSFHGAYRISVSLEKGCYRHLEISANATLFDLHAAILDAFEFDDDHLHAFFMDNRFWSNADSFYSELADHADRRTPDYTLGEIGLSVGKQFKYLFDFGDEWRFQCKVLKATEETVEEAKVVRSVGDAPEQYPLPEGEEEEGERIYPEMYTKSKLAQLYAQLALPKETVKLLLTYFDAFANLYGVLPLRKALEIYSEQNEPIPEADFEAFAQVVRHEEHDYTILGEDDLYTDGGPSEPLDREIIHDRLLMDDDLEDFKSAQEGKPYYLPSKRALLRYADDLYFERTPEFRALQSYLREERGLPRKKADDIAEELQLHASMGERDLAFILRDLERMGLKPKSLNETLPLTALFIELCNHTRMCVHRGHTAKELFGQGDTAPSITWGPGVAEAIRRGDLDLDAARAQARRMEFPSDECRNNYLGELDRIEHEARASAPRAAAPKIGRNAPCPCGSGKKYKHCCGKNA